MASQRETFSVGHVCERDSQWLMGCLRKGFAVLFCPEDQDTEDLFKDFAFKRSRLGNAW